MTAREILDRAAARREPGREPCRILTGTETLIEEIDRALAEAREYSDVLLEELRLSRCCEAHKTIQEQLEAQRDAEQAARLSAERERDVAAAKLRRLEQAARWVLTADRPEGTPIQTWPTRIERAIAALREALGAEQPENEERKTHGKTE